MSSVFSSPSDSGRAQSAGFAKYKGDFLIIHITILICLTCVYIYIYIYIVIHIHTCIYIYIYIYIYGRSCRGKTTMALLRKY